MATAALKEQLTDIEEALTKERQTKAQASVDLQADEMASAPPILNAVPNETAATEETIKEDDVKARLHAAAARKVAEHIKLIVDPGATKMQEVLRQVPMLTMNSDLSSFKRLGILYEVPANQE